MKIGILTQRPMYNYGGILQCLALQSVLEEMGHEAKVIRYIPQRPNTLKRRLNLLFTDFSFHEYREWVYKYIKKHIGKQYALPSTLLERCDLFINKHIILTSNCNESTIGLLLQAEDFDAVVIGSDQVWSGLGHERLVYFGDWSPKFNGRIISYAACSPVKRVPQFNRAKIRNLLSKFYAISVRDNHTQKLMAPYTPSIPKVVADPTLLYDFNKYITPNMDGDYIFAYILGREIKGGHKAVITEMKKRYGNIPIKAVVFTNQHLEITSCADEVIVDASPERWLNLLAHAKMVYTDSFHAVLFSLKYRRRFIAYYTELSRASRLVALRDSWGLKKHIVTSSADVIEQESLRDIPGYDYIDKDIKDLKDSSMEFLSQSLS